MNVVEAELHREPDGLRARFGPHDLRVDAGLAASRPALERYVGRRVVLGVRPQNVEDAALVDSGDTDSMIEATVELRDNLGPEVDVHVGIDAPIPALDAVIEATESADSAGAPGVAGRPEGIFVARLGAGTEAREGHQVKLWIDTRALHFFDPDSGAAISE
jgi:multiple sugar transport system ATP-binding protein